ncbi:MAG: GMC family oxidoreductase N-terminal domain-containing protein [Pseudomonadota bacterium]
MGEELEFDFVVLGGGSGGCTVAARLSEDPRVTVCLVEAGGPGDSVLFRAPAAVAAILPTPFHNWAYKTTPQAGLNGRRGYQPRGRTLGGSSAINAMLYVRGHRGDYDEWRDLGNPGWGFDDVLPYFKKAEANSRGETALHGATGPLSVQDQRSPKAITRAFMEAGQQLQVPLNDDFNGETQEGIGQYQVTQRDGVRCSAAAAYIQPNLNRPNLHIMTKSRVERLVLENGRATSARVRTKGGTKTIKARREIVLAGGAFGTPQLLMLSGIGPANHLQQMGIPVAVDAPEVGGNLQDHIDYTTAYKSKRRDVWGLSLGGTVDLVKAIFEWRRSKTGALTTPFAEGGAFLKSSPDIDRPDLQLHFVVGVVDDHMRKLHLGHGFSCHVCVLRPKSRGTVRLSSPNVKDAPAIDMGFFSRDEDLDLMLKGFRRMRQILEAPPLEPWRHKELYTAGVEDDAGLKSIIRDRADTVYHPVGTCRMGSDATAVVDPQLRVQGISGLRIADASIMPRIIGGNTNAPTIMIAEKCADMMRAA